MGGEWRAVSLGDLFKIKHGFAFKGEYFTDQPSPTVLVTPGNFAIGGGFQDQKRKYYQGPVPEDYVLKPGQIVVTMTDLSKQSDTLGHAARIPKDSNIWLHNQRVGLLVFNSGSPSVPRFIEYLLRSREYRSWVVGSATGTTVKHTSPGRIESYMTRVPPLPEQRAITSILAALDDKVDLNRRMNETLEAMARALFKDWFVYFGPTRAKMEGREPYLAPELWSLFPDRLDDEGKPEGWKVFRLEYIAQHHKHTITPSSEPETVFEHFSLPAFDKGQNPALDPGETIKSNKTVVPPGAVLLSKLNPEIPRVWLTEAADRHPQIASTEFLAFTGGNGAGRGLLFCLFSDVQFREMLQAMVTGTSKSHQRVSPPDLMRREVLAGHADLFDHFESLVGPLLHRVLANRNESRTLAQTRDLLLPKLMSGEIRVRDAERMVEEVV